MLAFSLIEKLKMNTEKLFELANHSGGTLYLMTILFFVALTVIIERTRHLLNMQKSGEDLMSIVKTEDSLGSLKSKNFAETNKDLPHYRVVMAYLDEPNSTPREAIAGHLEEALMHEVPLLDRSLWMLDTVITLAPLLGLFGTIIGMFKAFSVLDDIQNASSQVTGGIAEALISTACGLLIAMLGLIFYNWLNTHVRTIVHQLETVKIMLLNRHAA
jgi:biopolymer transport protein ExbB